MAKTRAPRPAGRFNKNDVAAFKRANKKRMGVKATSKSGKSGVRRKAAISGPFEPMKNTRRSAKLAGWLNFFENPTGR